MQEMFQEFFKSSRVCVSDISKIFPFIMYKIYALLKELAKV